MMKDVDKAQADRIFRSCDKAGDGKISLQEFRGLLQRGKEMQAKAQQEKQQQQPQQQQQQPQPAGGVIAKSSSAKQQQKQQQQQHNNNEVFN